MEEAAAVAEEEVSVSGAGGGTRSSPAEATCAAMTRAFAMFMARPPMLSCKLRKEGAARGKDAFA